MRLALVLVLLGLFGFAPGSLRAQEADAVARTLFEQGVVLGEAGDWSSAAAHFEQSLASADRPGTRVNLVHAYVALDRPLDVARHALVFLAGPEEPRRAEARKEVETALAGARGELAMLGTDFLPAGSSVFVDGAEPTTRDARWVYLLPGLHRLEVRVPGAPVEVIELSLAGGQALGWPRQGRPNGVEPVVVPASMPVAPSRVQESTPPRPELRVTEPGAPRWRRRLAIATGTLGASAAVTTVGMYLLTLQRADDVEHADPFVAGFFDKVYAYEDAAASVIPLAVSASILITAAILSGPRSSRWGSRASALVALGLGAALLTTGIVLSSRAPAKLGDTNVNEPSRELGAMVAAAAGPFLGHGVSVLVSWRRTRAGTRLAWSRPEFP